MKYEDSNTEILDFEPSKELVGNDVLIQDCVNGKILQFKEKHPAKANAIQEQLDEYQLKKLHNPLEEQIVQPESISQSKRKSLNFYQIVKTTRKTTKIIEKGASVMAKEYNFSPEHEQNIREGFNKLDENWN